MSWMQVAIETKIEWPLFETAITFSPLQFILRPASAFHSPDIVLEYFSNDSQSAHSAILEFMSVLAWLKRQRITETVPGTHTGRTPPCQIGPAPYVQNITDKFECTFTPDMTHQHAKIALAFFRDALQNPNVCHSFLSYWKIASLMHRDGSPEQVQFLVDRISKLNSPEAKSRRAELASAGLSDEDIVKRHLYGARRCAIAHANFNSGTVVNPDDGSAVSDVSADIALIYAIAESIIENDLGVKSESFLYKEKGLAVPTKSNRVLHTSSGQILEWKSGPIILKSPC